MSLPPDQQADLPAVVATAAVQPSRAPAEDSLAGSDDKRIELEKEFLDIN